jgi:hypothetical protein
MPERIVLGGRKCFHSFLKEQAIDLPDDAPIVIFNLRLKKDESLWSTAACHCWHRMTNVSQVSVRGLCDDNNAYIPGVLEIVFQEIEDAVTKRALPIIHCTSGMHRAPSALLVYLLKRAGAQRLCFNDALKLVVNWRSKAFSGDHHGQSPTNQFLNQIESFHRPDHSAIGLQAKRNNRNGGRIRVLDHPLKEGTHYRRNPFELCETTRPNTASPKELAISTKAAAEAAEVRAAQAAATAPTEGAAKSTIARTVAPAATKETLVATAVGAARVAAPATAPATALPTSRGIKRKLAVTTTMATTTAPASAAAGRKQQKEGTNYNRGGAATATVATATVVTAATATALNPSGGNNTRGTRVATVAKAAMAATIAAAADCGLECSFKCNQTAATHDARRAWCLAQLQKTFQVDMKTIYSALNHEGDQSLHGMYTSVCHDGVGVFALLMAAVASSVKSEQRQRFRGVADRMASAHNCEIVSFTHFLQVQRSTCTWLFPASATVTPLVPAVPRSDVLSNLLAAGRRGNK